jgi:hypothetical protein
VTRANSSSLAGLPKDLPQRPSWALYALMITKLCGRLPTARARGISFKGRACRVLCGVRTASGWEFSERRSRAGGDLRRKKELGANGHSIRDR